LVWHPGESGKKVVVFRNLIQQIMYPRNTASTREEMYDDHLACAIDLREGIDE